VPAFAAGLLALAAACGHERTLESGQGAPQSSAGDNASTAWRPTLTVRHTGEMVIQRDGRVEGLADGEQLFVFERRDALRDDDVQVETRRGGEIEPSPANFTANPGSGALVTTFEERQVRLPLERTEVAIDVVGPIVVGSVFQRFANPYDHAIEAVYVFPLPHDAAVHDFVLTIGERRIRGVVREREEARQLYEAARAQGYTASLLSQERPNVFTQSVANIAPGHAIDVELAYLEPVDLVDGWHQLAFPMVVGPRYNPVGYDKGIGAVARGTRSSSAESSSGQPTDVHYLRREERSGHDVSLCVTLRAGLALERIESPSHGVTIEERADATVVRLAAAEAIPNADFRLRWRIAHDGFAASLLRQGGHALLTVYPPDDLSKLPRRAIEHVFVLDTSGSMSGEPLATLKRAMRAALGRLAPGDTFDLLHFGSATGVLAERPFAVNAANLRRARQWLDGLQANGGTEMLPALMTALTRPTDRERPRVVTLLTDGYIGNEEQLFTAIQTHSGQVRVFGVGIGSSPNRWLLAELAARSGGSDVVIGLDEDPAPVIEAYFDRTSRPAVQDLQLVWSGASASVATEMPREILAGRPVVVPFALDVLLGKHVAVELQGRVGAAYRDLGRVEAVDCEELGPRALALVWTRARLAQLAAETRVASVEQRAELTQRMLALALEHGVVSSLTSLLAVDSAQPVIDGGEPERVDVAVPVPAGVSYPATVPGG
jgi:Ca-activated chloride channel family protein